MEQRFVRVGESEVHYLAAGAGPPLLLVHGLAASLRWWTPVLHTLTRRHRVYAFDLPGFGQSRGPERFSLKKGGRFVCDLMNALGLDRASLIGHSMGGRICMDVAADCPERVRGLVLVSAIGLPWGRSYPRVGWDLMRENWATPRQYLEWVRQDVARVGLLELARATYEVLSDDCRAHLARIRRPTLVLWGGRDVLTPPRAGRQLAAAIDHSELAVIPHAGHNPMWDTPEQFAHLVLDFLARRTGPPAAPRRAALALGA